MGSEDDDLFGDLLGPRPSPSSATQHHAPSSQPMKAAYQASKSLDNGQRRAVAPEAMPDLLSSPAPSSRTVYPSTSSKAGSSIGGVAEQERAESGAPSGSTTSSGLSITREELQDLVRESVATALDTTFTKFVRSLRTVLEDLSRRVDGSSAAREDMTDSLSALRDLVGVQTENTHARFTSLDLAIKEVDRGVQAIRDRQELAQAQAMLAKMSSPAAPGPNNTTSAGSGKQAATAGSSPQTNLPSANTAGESPIELQSVTVTAPAPVAITSSAPAIQAPAPAPVAVTATAPAPGPVQQQAPAAAPPQPQQLQQQQLAQSPQGYLPQQQQPQQQQLQPQQLHQQQQQQQPDAYGQHLQQPQQQQVPQYGPPQQHVQSYGQAAPTGAPLGVAHDPYRSAPMQPQLQQPPQQQGPPPQQQGPPPQQQGPPQQPSSHQLQQQQPPGFSGFLPAPMHPGVPPMLMPPPHSAFAAPTPASNGNLPPAGHQGHAGAPPMPMHMSSPHHMGPPPGPVYPSPGGLAAYPLPPQLQSQGSYGGGAGVPGAFRGVLPTGGSAPGGARGPPPESRTSSKAVPLEQIITDISAMGFQRHQVMAVVNSLQGAGQAVDLNVILDRLTRGAY